MVSPLEMGNPFRSSIRRFTPSDAMEYEEPDWVIVRRVPRGSARNRMEPRLPRASPRRSARRARPGWVATLGVLGSVLNGLGEEQSKEPPARTGRAAWGGTSGH